MIITTRNEEEHIEACLKSIARQTHTHIECIVVDNASSDNTKKRARCFTPHVFNKGPERSAQRNYGASKAHGKYLLFLDADMELIPRVVEECIAKIHDLRPTTYERSALIIPEKSIGSGFWAQCKILERSFYEDVDWMEAARFYDKTAFTALGGFDETLTGPEDFDLSQRVRERFGRLSVRRTDSYIYHNEGTIRLTDLLYKKYYYGKKMTRYLGKKQNTGAFAKQANPLFRYGLFFRKPRLLLSDPIHAIGLFIMKTLELGALAAGALSSKFIK